LRLFWRRWNIRADIRGPEQFRGLGFRLLLWADRQYFAVGIRCDKPAQQLLRIRQNERTILVERYSIRHVRSRWQGKRGGKSCLWGRLGCLACKGQGWKQGGGNNPNGVGTWAEETGWSYYPQEVNQTGVDNSGIERPNLDPRGLTERDSTLNDALKPTKVKGQMAPGGQMPSITLKGVAIKGQSKVQFEEAATAAQTEAQSALNQDQVPRA